jgi:hypothetical protein
MGGGGVPLSWREVREGQGEMLASVGGRGPEMKTVAAWEVMAAQERAARRDVKGVEGVEPEPGVGVAGSTYKVCAWAAAAMRSNPSHAMACTSD